MASEMVEKVAAGIWSALEGISHDGSTPWDSFAMRRYGGTSDARENVLKMARGAIEAMRAEQQWLEPDTLPDSGKVIMLSDGWFTDGEANGIIAGRDVAFVEWCDDEKVWEVVNTPYCSVTPLNILGWLPIPPIDAALEDAG